MTRALVLRKFASAVVLAALLGGFGAAAARPLDLGGDADYAALAHWMQDYRAVAQARWVIAAPDRASAEVARAKLLATLAPIDRDLARRLDLEVAAGPPKAFLRPSFGSVGEGPQCSWQVWVSDPDAPAQGEAPVMTPLAPNDRVPVGPTATFRIGHAGLLQARLYAFGETGPGAVRDLATAPDVNVPVAKGASDETIVLVASREPAPFFDELKTALADSRGERRDLGARYSLRSQIAGVGRGIGANIQAIPSTMIAAPTTKVDESSRPDVRALLETCVYEMIPRR